MQDAVHDGDTRSDLQLDPSTTQPIGQSFGRFEILDVLGTGGMGTVFEARDTMLGRAVALKLLHPALAERPPERRLLREAKALASLSHPNVVQVFDAGIADDRPFIAMELVRGRTLAQWQSQPRSWRECVEVYLQAGRGLAAAHAQGLVHRDFKPSNCIIDQANRVRVLDFGLARPIDASRHIGATMDAPSDASVSMAGAPRPGPEAHGTLGYMPLEQLWGQALDDKSDQFSLCVSLFEAVHGQRPFSGQSVDALITAMVDGRIDPPPDPGRAPKQLQRVLERGLRARPKDRWPSMELLLRELERLIAPPELRRRWALLGLGLGLGAGLVAAVGLAWATRTAPCEDPRGQLEDAWGEQSRARVAAVLERAVVDVPADALSRLDAYAERWIEGQQDACEAERDGTDDEARAHSRRTCLAEAHDVLQELAVLLGDGESHVLARGTRWIDELPELSRCGRPERFASRRPLPSDPELAAHVRTLRLESALVAALHQAGRYPEAMERLEPAIVQATALGYEPLLAELELLRGELWTDQGLYAAAEDDLERAYARAVEHEHSHIELSTAIALAYVVGDLRERHDVGLKWGLTAEALARQPWADPQRRAGAKEILGNLYYEQGRFTMALERYQQALEVHGQLQPNSPIVTLTLANVGLVLHEQGRYEEALPVLREVLEDREAELDPLHPAVAVSLLSLGTTLHRLGQHAEALSLYSRALDVREQTLGLEHPGVLLVLNALGQLWEDLGEPAHALDAYQRALAIGTVSMDASHSHVAASWLGLARVLGAHGLHEAAARHAGRGTRMLEQAVGPTHVKLGPALVTLGRIEHERGERGQAREHLERAIEILASTEHPPEQLADAQLELAKVLWHASGEQDAALGLATRARDTYEQRGELTRREAEAARAWIEARTVRAGAP